MKNKNENDFDKRTVQVSNWRCFIDPYNIIRYYVHTFYVNQSRGITPLPF